MQVEEEGELEEGLAEEMAQVEELVTLELQGNLQKRKNEKN